MFEEVHITCSMTGCFEGLKLHVERVHTGKPMSLEVRKTDKDTLTYKKEKENNAIFSYYSVRNDLPCTTVI